MMHDRAATCSIGPGRRARQCNVYGPFLAACEVQGAAPDAERRRRRMPGVARARGRPRPAEARPPGNPLSVAAAGPPRRTMTISSLLTPELVLPALPARAKAEVLDTLAAHVGRAHPQVDTCRLASALHERERQSTTALENGIAIPHVRLAGLSAALSRTTSAIACGAVDGRRTQL